MSWRNVLQPIVVVELENMGIEPSAGMQIRWVDGLVMTSAASSFRSLYHVANEYLAVHFGAWGHDDRTVPDHPALGLPRTQTD